MTDDDLRSVDEMTPIELLKTSRDALEIALTALYEGSASHPNTYAVMQLAYAISDLHVAVSKLIKGQEAQS
jgi:hypothetical protein